MRGRWLAHSEHFSPIVAVTVIRGVRSCSEASRTVSILDLFTSLFPPVVMLPALKKNQERDGFMPQSSEKVQSKTDLEPHV